MADRNFVASLAHSRASPLAFDPKPRLTRTEIHLDLSLEIVLASSLMNSTWEDLYRIQEATTKSGSNKGKGQIMCSLC